TTRPGPPAASAAAVAREALPISQALPAPSPTCVNAPAGWSAAEERRPGVDDLLPRQVRSRTGPVVGYLDATSAVCGQRLGVHLSGRAPVGQVRLRALRIGDYGGHGSRLVWESGPVTVHHEPDAAPTGPDKVVAEHWPVTTRLDVTAQWPPGLYLVEVVPVAQPGSPSYLPLVVQTSGARSPYLMVAGDLTWLAYDEYGGSSLYAGPGQTHQQKSANRSYVASADRPLTGDGLTQVLAMDVPLVRFLSRHHLATDLTTVTSLDATPDQVRGRSAVLLGGHTEYWTLRAYDALVAARDGGTNLASLGANEIYWQARVERDPTGRATGMTVYRLATLDGLAARTPQTTTVQWRSRLLHRDPAALVGLGMSAVGVHGSYTVRTAPEWLFGGTSLRPGSVLTGVVGYEVDAVEPPGGSTPANTQVLLQTVVPVQGRSRPSLATAGYHSAASGAGVFAAGTTYWSCDLDATCPNGPVPAATVAALDRITLNLLTAFATPRAGARHPSVATAYPALGQDPAGADAS
ncbi:N,N-dimethylformamidase beta subunit family domain-containing protein, partial [Oryzihumus sp.]|uniref:N,N-dimethylformamidase beta subunit family domain-containing protein n=1 Tax=Oryzihumus sp. TaxID=1968903 RepID=UPI002ED873A8